MTVTSIAGYLVTVSNTVASSTVLSARRTTSHSRLHASDPVFARYIKQYLELIAVRTNTTSSDKVREFVWMLLPEGRCSIEQIAQHMGVDRRSVQRRLDREETALSSIVEAVRMEMILTGLST